MGFPQGVTDFVAEFRNDKDLQRALAKNEVAVPQDWPYDLANFSVVQDRGTELELAFWNYDTDKQVGEELIVVQADDVICWA